MHPYSKVPIIRTGTYASSAVHTMYCQNCPMFGTYNRSFRVHGQEKGGEVSKRFMLSHVTNDEYHLKCPQLSTGGGRGSKLRKIWSP